MIEIANKLDKVRVLIVESHKITRIGLQCALKEYSHINVVGEAGDANEAFYLIDSLKPDVVIIDLTFMGVKGLETTYKIREMAKDTHVIVLSAGESKDEILASLGAGANAYCLKDIAPDALSMVIKTVARGACWVDPIAASAVMSCFPKPKNIASISMYRSDSMMAPLSEREHQVLRLLVDGKSNTEIAEELIVSVHTAKAHVCNILQKMCVTDRVQAAVKAVKCNLV